MTDIISNPQEFVGKSVHVEGWKFACVFNLEKTDGKTHHLITPRTGKRYTTTNNLIYTNKSNPRKVEILG